MRSFALFFTIVLGFYSACSFGQGVIRTSVSAEFVDGLQVKYLKNIARHMNMEIEIIPMPFARRLRELRLGHLDVLIGLQRVGDEQDEVVYIKPSYETLRRTFFVRNENINKLHKWPLYNVLLEKYRLKDTAFAWSHSHPESR